MAHFFERDRSISWSIPGSLGVWLFAVSVFGAGGADPTLPVIDVGMGITPLLERSEARIGYRLDGTNRSVWLGVGWRGDDQAVGTQFRPDSIRQGRQVWFMHCPWRKGPGETFAEFSVKLPDARPLCLAVAIGIREDAPHSDGVTYRVSVDGKEIFARHCNWKGLRESRIDLAPYAGRRVRIRLTVDPGPARETRDDWALWGKADIEAGTPEQIAAARKDAEQEAADRRRKELDRGAEFAEADLTPVAGADARGVCPGTLEKVANAVAFRGDTVVFRARGSGDDLVFELQPAAGPFAALAVRSRANILTPAPFTGSVRFGPKYDGPRPPRFETMRLDAKTGVLECLYRTTDAKSANPATGELRVRWSIHGKSLRVELAAPAGRFTGVQLATLGDQSVPAPFGPGAQYREREKLYLAIAGDLWHSNASGIGRDGSAYTHLTNGKYNPLHDVFYLTVSRRYAEVLPNTPYPPSPFLEDLAGRVILDVWHGKFAADARWLQEMAGYGVDHCVIIKHVWQRDGYDCTYPDTMPANAAQGGDAGLRALTRTAIGLGHRFCVHENYYDYYPNAEDFLKQDCALKPDGTKIKGWQRGAVKAWFLKPSKLLAYARRFSPEIRKRYGCNAAYHDIMPNGHVDYEARAPGAGMIRYTHAQTRELVEFDHALYKGPVLFEGLGTTLAGMYDGGTSGPLNEENLSVAVAPELIVVHPKQSNHGMSYYERWLESGYGPGWGSYVMTNRERDHYRAMTIAFGRTGLIGHQLMKAPHGVVREYHLFQAFGRAYTGKHVVHIRYEGDRPGQWLDAGTAGRYHCLDRLWVTYEDGQQVYVNLAPRDWEIGGRILPQYGMLTVGPRAAAWTARMDGQIADFARYGDVLYADARSHWWHPTRDPNPIRARAIQFKDLGHGRFRIAVEWTPGRKIRRDLLVFWHFRDKRGIRFQNDHRPTPRTSAWGGAEPVLDGPHAMTVPDGADTRYLFFVGLYDKTGREPLYAAADELLLGTLEVERTTDKKVKALRFVPSKDPVPGNADPARYAIGNNAVAKILDFGEVSTNGALILRRDGPVQNLIPVPFGTVFEVGLRGAVHRIIAVGAKGKPLGPVPFERRGGRTWFRTHPPAARYFRIAK